MKDRYRRILSLITCVMMIMPLLCAGAASAEERNTDILGKPFPAGEKTPGGKKP